MGEQRDDGYPVIHRAGEPGAYRQSCRDCGAELTQATASEWWAVGALVVVDEGSRFVAKPCTGAAPREGEPQREAPTMGEQDFNGEPGDSNNRPESLTAPLGRPWMTEPEIQRCGGAQAEAAAKRRADALPLYSLGEYKAAIRRAREEAVREFIRGIPTADVDLLHDYKKLCSPATNSFAEWRREALDVAERWLAQQDKREATK